MANVAVFAWRVDAVNLHGGPEMPQSLKRDGYAPRTPRQRSGRPGGAVAPLEMGPCKMALLMSAPRRFRGLGKGRSTRRTLARGGTGAAAGRAWLVHHPDELLDISLSKAYWVSRAKAAQWAAFYSLQFEFGPLSEASIGNVGTRAETTGWVDHVVTPVGAFGLIVAEDALDRFFVRWVDARTSNRVARASLRLLFNPARTLSNAVGGKLPWYRRDRSLSWR